MGCVGGMKGLMRLKQALTVVLGNIVVIGLLIAAFVGYSAYQQKQGRTASGKKRM